MVLRLTRTGKIFLGVIVTMHLASITSQSGLLIWLVGLIVGCMLVNAVASIRSVKHVSLRTPLRMLVEQGSAPREPWELKNDGKWTARLIMVESRDRVWLRAPEIRAGETLAVPPRNVFKERGVYPLADAMVVSLFPFGLAKAARDAEAVGEVLVYPKLEKVAAPAVRGLEPMFGGHYTGIGRSAAGSKFAGVRPIQNGDSFKQIHWKSSSKGGGLMVKTYEEELAGRAALLVFCEAGSPQAEETLRMAGSLTLAGLEAGHHIDWHNLNENRRVLLPPFSDVSTLLEELARYKIMVGEVSNETLQHAIDMIRPRVAIHLVVTSLMPLFEKAVDELRRRDRLVVVHSPKSGMTDIEQVVSPFAEA